MDNKTPELIDRMRALADSLNRPVQLMEVCGTHTVSIFRNGIRSLLPGNVRLVSGPGCPVCVTAQRHIDGAVQLAAKPDVIVTTYGDMIRVPGRLGSLEHQRGQGSDVRIVGSTRTALQLARHHPERQVTFVSVGFETTAPATAAALMEADREGIENFSIVPAHKLVVPAMLALLGGGDVPLDGFLCPGHVSVIIGSEAYRPVVERFAVPCVIAGFEPVGILSGLVALLQQIENQEARVENCYPTAVTAKGNPEAQRLLDQVFVVADAHWRALGVIPDSGLDLRGPYKRFDALDRFGIELGEDMDHPACRCGEVIQGKVTPDECQLFGRDCTPTDPLGPCMVSSEGTCSAWYKYNRPTLSDPPSAGRG